MNLHSTHSIPWGDRTTGGIQHATPQVSRPALRETTRQPTNPSTYERKFLSQGTRRRGLPALLHITRQRQANWCGGLCKPSIPTLVTGTYIQGRPANCARVLHMLIIDALPYTLLLATAAAYFHADASHSQHTIITCIVTYAKKCWESFSSATSGTADTGIDGGVQHIMLPTFGDEPQFDM